MNLPKFEKCFSSEHWSDENSVILQNPFHFRKKSGQIIDPMSRQGTAKKLGGVNLNPVIKIRVFFLLVPFLKHLLLIPNAWSELQFCTQCLSSQFWMELSLLLVKLVKVQSELDKGSHSLSVKFVYFTQNTIILSFRHCYSQKHTICCIFGPKQQYKF